MQPQGLGIVNLGPAHQLHGAVVGEPALRALARPDLELGPLPVHGNGSKRFRVEGVAVAVRHRPVALLGDAADFFLLVPGIHSDRASLRALGGPASVGCMDGGGGRE